MNKLYYTALGDSLTNSISSTLCYGFAYRLCRYLKDKHYNVHFKNTAQPGLTSSGLMNQLEFNDALRSAIEEADLITITLGSNNLLRCTSNNYCRINEKTANEAVSKFKEDWLDILYCIRTELNCEADIYVLNIYNPYSIKDSNYELADHYIKLVNRAIAFPPLVKDYDYSVVDIYNCFKNADTNYLTFFDYPFSYIIRDPHPNYEGHYKMTKELIKCINSHK